MDFENYRTNELNNLRIKYGDLAFSYSIFNLMMKGISNIHITDTDIKNASADTLHTKEFVASVLIIEKRLASLFNGDPIALIEYWAKNI